MTTKKGEARTPIATDAAVETFKVDADPDWIREVDETARMLGLSRVAFTRMSVTLQMARTRRELAGAVSD